MVLIGVIKMAIRNGSAIHHGRPGRSRYGHRHRSFLPASRIDKRPASGVDHAKMRQAHDTHRELSLEPGSVFDAVRAGLRSNVNAGLRRADEDQSEVLVMLVQTSGELASGHSATGAHTTEVQIATFSAIFLPTYAAVKTTSTSEDI
jgi:hypothetical protein